MFHLLGATESGKLLLLLTPSARIRARGATCELNTRRCRISKYLMAQKFTPHFERFLHGSLAFRMVIACFVLVVGCFPMLHAADREPADVDRRGEIGGQVLDAKGQPVFGAEVWIDLTGEPVLVFRAQEKPNAVTGVDGRWRFHNVPLA